MIDHLKHRSRPWQLLIGNLFMVAGLPAILSLAALRGQVAEGQSAQGSAAAQEQPGTSGTSAEDPAQSRSASFEAVTGPTREDVPGGPLLLGAYACIWILLLLYIGRMARLQAATRCDLERLRGALEAATTSKE